jgi:hypothetical protein
MAPRFGSKNACKWSRDVNVNIFSNIGLTNKKSVLPAAGPGRAAQVTSDEERSVSILIGGKSVLPAAGPGRAAQVTSDEERSVSILIGGKSVLPAAGPGRAAQVTSDEERSVSILIGRIGCGGGFPPRLRLAIGAAGPETNTVDYTEAPPTHDMKSPCETSHLALPR